MVSMAMLRPTPARWSNGVLADDLDVPYCEQFRVASELCVMLRSCRVSLIREGVLWNKSHVWWLERLFPTSIPNQKSLAGFSEQMADANNRPTDAYHMYASAIMMRPGVRRSLILIAGHASSPPTMRSKGVPTTPLFTCLRKKL